MKTNFLICPNSIANWSPKIGEQKVAAELTKAFDKWAPYGRISFVRTYDQSADIIIAFGSGYHGDRQPFDGPGNTLAHAYYPYEMGPLGGDIHFDDDENWGVAVREPNESNVLYMWRRMVFSEFSL